MDAWVNSLRCLYNIKLNLVIFISDNVKFSEVLILLFLRNELKHLSSYRNINQTRTKK